MEGGGVAESQISASSVRYTFLGLQRWGPELARLNMKGLVNAWSPAPHDRNPWLQVRPPPPPPPPPLNVVLEIVERLNTFVARSNFSQ